MQLQRAREALYSYRIFEHERKESVYVCVWEKERECERMYVSITDDGQNQLSRKWNSFTGFSVFDRSFVYRSRWMAVWIWKDRLLRAQRSHIRVYVNSATSVAQLLYLWSREFLFFFLFSQTYRSRSLPARSNDVQFRPIRSSDVDAVHAKIVTLGTVLMIHM